MDTKVIPFPLDEKATVSFTTTLIALAAIQAMNETGRTAKIIHQGRPPRLPHRSGRWELSEVEEESALPIEIQRRINILRHKNIPIKQLLIAHEHPKELPKPAEAPRLHSEASNHGSGLGTALSWITVGLVVIVALVPVLPMLMEAFWSLVQGVAIVVAVLGGLLMFGNDPVVVAILDDGCDSWVSLGFWIE